MYRQMSGVRQDGGTGNAGQQSGCQNLAQPQVTCPWCPNASPWCPGNSHESFLPSDRDTYIACDFLCLPFFVRLISLHFQNGAPIVHKCKRIKPHGKTSNKVAVLLPSPSSSPSRVLTIPFLLLPPPEGLTDPLPPPASQRCSLTAWLGL